MFRVTNIKAGTSQDFENLQDAVKIAKTEADQSPFEDILVVNIENGASVRFCLFFGPFWRAVQVNSESLELLQSF
jgi:hypothetical protein